MSWTDRSNESSESFTSFDADGFFEFLEEGDGADVEDVEQVTRRFSMLFGRRMSTAQMAAFKRASMQNPRASVTRGPSGNRKPSLMPRKLSLMPEMQTGCVMLSTMGKTICGVHFPRIL